MPENKMTTGKLARTSVSPVIDGRQLTRLAEVGGYQSQLSKPAAYGQALARGRFECVTYPAGLSVHVCDLEELDGTTTDSELSPRLSFLFLLRGKLSFRLNDQAFQLCSAAGPRCAAMILEAPTHWERDLQRGCNLTKAVPDDGVRIYASLLPDSNKTYLNGKEQRLYNVCPGEIVLGSPFEQLYDRPSRQRPKVLVTGLNCRTKHRLVLHEACTHS